MARGAALAAALAVSLLAVSGAGGAGAQTPKRGGTLVFAQPAPEPACLNLLVPQCIGAAGIQLISVWRLVLEAPFDLGGDLTWRPGLVSSATFTTRPPYTLTYRIRPEARWSDGTPVTARDFAFTHATILRYDNGPLKTLHSEVRSVRAVDPKTVRVDPPLPGRGVARALQRASTRPTRSGARRPPRGLARSDRRPEDRTPDRERSVPRRALGPRAADRARAQPALLGRSSLVRRPARNPLRRPGRRSPRPAAQRPGSRRVQLPARRSSASSVETPISSSCRGRARPGSASTSVSGLAAIRCYGRSS